MFRPISPSAERDDAQAVAASLPGAARIRYGVRAGPCSAIPGAPFHATRGEVDRQLTPFRVGGGQQRRAPRTRLASAALVITAPWLRNIPSYTGTSSARWICTAHVAASKRVSQVAHHVTDHADAQLLRFSGVPLYLKDGHAFRGLNTLFPPCAAVMPPGVLLLKPVGLVVRPLTGMSTSAAGSTARRYRDIAAWPTLVPPKW